MIDSTILCRNKFIKSLFCIHKPQIHQINFHLMISTINKFIKSPCFLIVSSISTSTKCNRYVHSSSLHSQLREVRVSNRNEQCLVGSSKTTTTSTTKLSDIDVIVSKARAGTSDDEVFQTLVNDEGCILIQPSHSLVEKLLFRFKDDWKSALGVFRWAESYSGYKHLQESCDVMVDILGKAKQMDRMKALLEEMRDDGLVTLNTVAKVMRRLSGAGKWEDAARMFDELGTFGLEKDTESMNLLLDTLCKEKKVEQARDIFMQLKSHISPNAHTFNIFIHGWCKANRVDEANWTIQEMKGYGIQPCVISYSTIVEFYCRKSKFDKAYELLDEMEAQGLRPNVITFTTIMSSMVKSGEVEQALQVPARMKSTECKPDTLFYNCLIHTLGRAGLVGEAVNVFETEMSKNGVKPNTSTYNSMIAMFCHHGQEQKAFGMLNQIENSTVCKPDVQTYYPLLKSCFKTGKTDTCLSKLVDDMVSVHHFSLDTSTYALLIHGLCRANKCQWAYHLFDEMTSKELTPKYQTCRLLLDECNQIFMYDAAEKIESYMKKLK